MDSFALYVHLPFCLRKCPYCAFASSVIDNPEDAESVLDGIVNEAESRSEKNPWKALRVHSLYLGGGTPSVLYGRQIRRLVGALRELFQFLSDAECTIEINPGTITPEKVEGWFSAGINRASLGVQSLDDDTLELLGRIHDSAQARNAYSLLNDNFPKISSDLIFGVNTAQAGTIPNYNIPWRKTLEEVISWRPEHISAYALSIEEGTPFQLAAENGAGLRLEEEQELEQYMTAVELLSRAGYEHYEVSNWAFRDDDSSSSPPSGIKASVNRCRHNLSYWDDSCYLALGPSGHSYDLSGPRRFWNYRNTSRWLESVRSQGTGEKDSEVLTPLQQYEERIMLGLRLVEGIREQTLSELAAPAGVAWPPSSLNRIIKGGLLKREGKYLRYTLRGLLLADTLEARLSL